MIDKNSGTVSAIEIQLMNGERISFHSVGSPWYFEFKDGFLEVCSNNYENSIDTERNFIPLVNLKRMATKDIQNNDKHQV